MSIVLHPGQSEIFSDLFVTREVKHAVGVCSRGYGKSFLGGSAGLAAVSELIALPDYVPNKNVFIIAPTYAQVTNIYYPLLIYQMGAGAHCIKHSKDTGVLVFPNNVELRLVSYEAVARLRGEGAYFIVCDEVRDWTSGPGYQDAWESVLLPCITTRWSPKQAAAVGAKSSGRSLTISTPKGYDYLHEISTFEKMDPRYRTYTYDYTQSPLLDQEEVEKLRHTTDPIKFAREYLASFKDSGNTVFYCFDRAIHVQNDIEYFRMGTAAEQGEDVHVGIDLH